jgi:hypothetical protein
MSVYVDHTTDEWVGEYEYRDPDCPEIMCRDTEWFDTEAEALQFARTGIVA